MRTLKSKERFGNFLYILAIVIMMINLYQLGADDRNNWIEAGSWLMLLVASFYGLWLGNEKKKQEEEE